MNNWNKIFKPIVVLSVICVIIAGALAVTNYATKPVIEEATRKAQDAARLELLPEADSFTEAEGISVADVSNVYVANNGVGVVVTAVSKGYGGTMTVMVGFNADGTIRQIKVTEQAETKGIGSKVAGDPAFWDRYAGKSTPVEMEALSGATVSSEALYAAINAAIDGYNALG